MQKRQREENTGIKEPGNSIIFNKEMNFLRFTCCNGIKLIYALWDDTNMLLEKDMKIHQKD